MRIQTLACSLLLTACATDNRPNDAFATDEGSGGSTGAEAGESSAEAGGDTGETAGETTAETGEEDTAADGGPLLDTLPEEATAEGGEPGDGCTFVDLLFVIDNSLSMGSHQEGLAAAFPGFVDEIVDNLPEGTDLHVGITTTSFFNGGCSESTSNCASGSSEAEILMHYDEPGASNNGENGGQGRLFEFQGQSYFEANTSDDSAALKSWFTGAAVAAGETGCSFEMMAAGAGWAVSPDNDATNAGFLRDEGAALMIFVVTDEPDKSPGVVDEHVQRVLDAKAGCGGAECVVTGGLVPSTCYDSPADTTLFDFLNAFGEEPVVGLLAGFQFPGDPPPDYSGVLGPGLAQILGQTCENIPPVD